MMNGYQLAKKLYVYCVPKFGKKIYRHFKMKNYQEMETIWNADLAPLEYQYILQTGKYELIPYRWIEEYTDEATYRDRKGWYTIVNGKKMYWPREYGHMGDAGKKLKRLFIEQDERSPHRYFSPNVNISDNTIFFDLGASEGLITLMNIETLKKAYLFEGDLMWLKCLKNTFSEFHDKVVIVDKYVSDEDGKRQTVLDKYIEMHRDEEIIIKMDIEGAEKRILKYMIDKYRDYNIKYVCCVYHGESDEKEMKKIFQDANYQFEFSDGYMCLGNPKSFRKGIIRAWK